MKSVKIWLGLWVVVLTFFSGESAIKAEQTLPQHILIHIKTSLAEDDAQICAAPNVAWAMVNAGHQAIVQVDASAVTSVTKGFGWWGHLKYSDTTGVDRAKLPERERISLADQMGVPLEVIPIALNQMAELFHSVDRIVVY